MFASGIASLGRVDLPRRPRHRPSLAAALSLAGRLAPGGTVTEAFTWVGTAMGMGFAVGGALGGAIVEGSGASAFAFSAGARGRPPRWRSAAGCAPRGLTRHNSAPPNLTSLE